MWCLWCVDHCSAYGVIVCSSDTSALAVSTFGIQVRYTTAISTDCVMLGDNSLTNCAHAFAWPAANSEVSTNGNTTSSRTDVQTAAYNKGVGDYTVSQVFVRYFNFLFS
jgi:hypothetical protein